MTVSALLAKCITAGDRVDLLCRLHNVSNAELARAAGCSPQNIGHLRNNKIKSPSADLLGAIADFFQVDDRLLRTGQPREAQPEYERARDLPDKSPRAEFETFMRAVTAAARDDDEARDIVTKAVRLVLEDLERQRLPRRPRTQRVS
jgi:transcriptional regulator with XRE-family HTH domain